MAVSQRRVPDFAVVVALFTGLAALASFWSQINLWMTTNGKNTGEQGVFVELPAPKDAGTHANKTTSPSPLGVATILMQGGTHTTYKYKDAFAEGLRSIERFRKNYPFPIPTLWVTHEGDLTPEHKASVRAVYPESEFVDLRAAGYWETPEWVKPHRYRPIYSEGYRRMIRWFAFGMWKFFHEKGIRYVMRLDDDSTFFTPFEEDPFLLMQREGLAYTWLMDFEEDFVGKGFWETLEEIRQEMGIQRNMSESQRPLDQYNNYMVGDTEYFWGNPRIREYLSRWDRSGVVFTGRVGDMVILSSCIHLFDAPRRRTPITTYEHTTHNNDGCPLVGGIVRSNNCSEDQWNSIWQDYRKRKGCDGCKSGCHRNNDTIFGRINSLPKQTHGLLPRSAAV